MYTKLSSDDKRSIIYNGINLLSFMAFFSFIHGIGVYNYDTSTQEATEYCYGLIILGGLLLFYSTYGFLKLFKLKKIEYNKNYVYIYEEN